ncbi:MAG: hypothetical protein II336_10540 [Loktanella sp.]|nr:hypothetical protein [Loktanella sp.]
MVKNGGPICRIAHSFASVSFTDGGLQIGVPANQSVLRKVQNDGFGHATFHPVRMWPSFYDSPQDVHFNPLGQAVQTTTYIDDNDK